MRLLRRNVPWAQSLNFVPCQWLAGMSGELLLLLFKRHGRRRRRPPGHDAAVFNTGGWLRDAVPPGSVFPVDTVSSGNKLGPVVDGRRGNLLLIHTNNRPADRLSARKSVLRNGGHPAGYAPVRVSDIGIISSVSATIVVCHLIVVNVYDRGVVDGRVADVNSGYILAAGVIPGHIDFSWTKRKPSHIAAAAASAQRNRQTESRSADKRYQRRSVYRPDRNWARHPAPAISCVHPASVMEWSVAPWRVIHPGPSPGGNPGPMTVAIGSPSRSNSRHPYVAVIRIGTPGAVVIQVLIADNIA